MYLFTISEFLWAVVCLLLLIIRNAYWRKFSKSDSICICSETRTSKPRSSHPKIFSEQFLRTETVSLRNVSYWKFLIVFIIRKLSQISILNLQINIFLSHSMPWTWGIFDHYSLLCNLPCICKLLWWSVSTFFVY